MKKILVVLLGLTLVLFGCSSEKKTTKDTIETAVVFGSSLTDIINKSNINVIGTTTDSFDNGIIEDVEDIGGLITPNMEQVVELNPDVVIIYGKHPKYESIKELLETANITVMNLEYNSFDEYKEVITKVADLTNDDSYYGKMVGEVEAEINDYIVKATNFDSTKALVVRSSTSSFSVINNTYFSNEIIENMNIVNIANINDKINADLSVEYILEEDPEYIFIIQMGDETSLQGYNEYILANGSWSNLSAVKSGNVYYLPKELFHLKPNEKWSEAYEYIYEILQQ